MYKNIDELMGCLSDVNRNTVIQYDSKLDLVKLIKSFNSYSDNIVITYIPFPLIGSYVKRMNDVEFAKAITDASNNTLLSSEDRKNDCFVIIDKYGNFNAVNFFYPDCNVTTFIDLSKIKV